MTQIVLDCSIAVSWLFEDEASESTDQIMITVKDKGAYVPNLWHLEVVNVLIQASKQNRLDYTSIPARLDILSRLPIKTDLEMHTRAFSDTLYLAEERRLTSYDAAYLELAFRRKLILATKDKALKKAAEHLEIPLLF